MDQVLNAPIEGYGVDHPIAWTREGTYRGHDRGHAGVKDGGCSRPGLQRHHLILGNLGIWMIQPRVDQVDALAIRRTGSAGCNGEGAFRSLRRRKYVGGTPKNRWAR
jgi:hypothetical protein